MQHKRKIKLIDRSRFETFLSIVGLAVLLLVVTIVPRAKSPIEKWHDAIESGMSWNEYIKEME